MASQASSDALSSDGLTLIDQMSGVVSFFVIENVTIVVWHSKPDPEAVERLGRVSEKRRKQFPNGVSVIHLVQGQFELPDTPTREAFVKVIKEGEGTLAIVAVVVTGGGFWASAVRSLVTGIRVLSRGSYDMGLHGEIDDVVKWLPPKHSARTGMTITPDQLDRALRRAHRWQPPQ